MPATFRRAVVEHAELLYALAVSLLGDHAEAEDLVQDTYARALRSWHGRRHAGSLRAWLVRIQRNLYIDHYRRQRRMPELVAVEDADQLGELAVEPAVSLAIEQSVDDDIDAALARLSEPLRTTIWLCDVEGWSYAEVAESMSCPGGTVKSRLHRARATLAIELARRSNTRLAVQGDR